MLNFLKAHTYKKKKILQQYRLIIKPLSINDLLEGNTDNFNDSYEIGAK